MSLPRLFLAIWPPDEVVADLELLHRKPRPGVNFVAPERWHVTLAFLGAADPQAVRSAIGGLVLPTSTIRLGPIVEMLGDHSVVVPADGAEALAAKVSRATAGLGAAPPRRRFVGHLTLARLNRRARERRHQLVGTPFESEFTAREVVLAQSRLGDGPAKYEIVDAWATADHVS